MTPLLIFFGIPPAVAVSTEANQIVASSVSGVLAHMRRGNVDFKMGGILMVGGVIGSSLGVALFSFLREIGQIDLVIQLSYVVFLGIIGSLMLTEHPHHYPVPQARRGARKLHQHNWLHGLPLKMRFRRSKLYISAIMPLLLEAFVGVLAAVMGVGGGFIMVPAMIYLLGMPTSVVVGTSLFQIIFVTANVTLLQSIQTQTVDFVLAGLLLFGAVIGAQFGSRAGALLRGEQLAGLLALMVLGVCIKIATTLWSSLKTCCRGASAMSRPSTAPRHLGLLAAGLASLMLAMPWHRQLRRGWSRTCPTAMSTSPAAIMEQT